MNQVEHQEPRHMETRSFTDLHVSREGHVALVEMRRPPHNYFDVALISALADALEDLEADPGCRAVVLAAQGTAFCAGANFGGGADPESARSPRALNPIYAEALRVFATSKPIVAAVHGPAVGGGLGLALAADFRVSCPQARFSANFNRLGFHPGFGLSVTLPRLVGTQQAALLLYTGRRIDGTQAMALGLVDELVPDASGVRAAALALAEEIAVSAPLAVQATRRTLRQGLLADLRHAVARESEEQVVHFRTQDFCEGVQAMSERRAPRFAGV
jgi:enoyl-CoA hydratase/carnithine racemase